MPWISTTGGAWALPRRSYAILIFDGPTFKANFSPTCHQLLRAGGKYEETYHYQRSIRRTRWIENPPRAPIIELPNSMPRKRVAANRFETPCTGSQSWICRAFPQGDQTRPGIKRPYSIGTETDRLARSLRCAVRTPGRIGLRCRFSD